MFKRVLCLRRGGGGLIEGAVFLHWALHRTLSLACQPPVGEKLLLVDIRLLHHLRIPQNKGRLQHRLWGGQDILLFRSVSGSVEGSDSLCPPPPPQHLGSRVP